MEKQKKLKNKKKLVELEASLAPAEAEVGAVAKADQYHTVASWSWLGFALHWDINECIHLINYGQYIYLLSAYTVHSAIFIPIL